MLTFAESTHPVFRSTSPLSRGVLKSKGGGKLSIHYCADPGTIETVFRTIVSANQLSLYGAVAEICEEYESLHERTGRPVVMGQSSSSLVLSVIKTEVLLDCDDLANVKASVFCNVSARPGHFVNVDVVFLPSVCDSFCVSALSLGQGSRSFCHKLYEQSTVMFCESGRDACFEIVCILCADHVFLVSFVPLSRFQQLCLFSLFGLHANILGSMCC